MAISLRVSGDGFVVEAETFKDLKRVMLEKTTMTCEDGWKHFPNARELVFNGVGCTRTTTSTKVCLLRFCYLMQYCLSERQSQRKAIPDYAFLHSTSLRWKNRLRIPIYSTEKLFYIFYLLLSSFIL